MANQTAIEKYMLISESKAVEILFWLLHNRDSENRLYTTLAHIAAETGVTKVTVNRIFQRLYRAGFLKKIRNGQYQMEKI